MPVSHVAELRFIDVNDAKMSRIREHIVETLLFHGYIEGSDFFFQTGSIDETIVWKERPENEPSSGQVGYLRSLYADLKRLRHNCTDAQDIKNITELLSTIANDMAPSDEGVTKRRASELINAAKAAVDELTFKQKGVRTNEFT